MPLIEGQTRSHPRRKRQDGKQHTRDAIIDAAAAAFIERGFNGTSLREVASRAGLSHTGLLHHFPDRVALLEAVLDDRIGGAAERFALDSDDGMEFLVALVQLAEVDMQRPANIALFTILSAEALAPDHPAHQYFARWQADVRRRLETAFTQLADRGLYHGGVPPRTAALHVSAMRDGIALEWLLAPNDLDLADAVRSQLGLYVRLPDGEAEPGRSGMG